MTSQEEPSKNDQIIQTLEEICEMMSHFPLKLACGQVTSGMLHRELLTVNETTQSFHEYRHLLTAL